MTTPKSPSLFEIDYELWLDLKVVVDSFVSVPPNPNSWDSPEDYYGYTEIDWHFENSKGDRVDIPVPPETIAHIERMLKDEYERLNEEASMDRYDCEW